MCRVLDKCRAKEYLKLNDQCRTFSNILDGTECHSLLDKGASKNLMFKTVI